MQLVFGTRYTFLSNGCGLASRTRRVLSDFGQVIRYVSRVDVEGCLEGTSQSDLSDQEDELRTALLYAYQDLKFLDDNGATTAVSLLNSETLSGVRVVDGPHFAGTEGDEYATGRRFAFTVEAEFIVPGTESSIISFQERLTFQGNGGPVRRIRVPINTPRLVRQQISPASVIRATQSGRAVGHTRYPVPPRPLWPAYLLHDQVVGGDKDEPKLLGRKYVDYPISWSYAYESDVPLVGVPTLLPPVR